MSQRNSLFRIGIISVVVGLLIFLARGAAFGEVRNGLLALILPVGGAARNISEFTRGFFFNSDNRVRALEEERTKLLGEIALLEDAKRENATLREALRMRAAGWEGVSAATVTGVFREGRDEFLLINRGDADGLKNGDLVMDRDHVLGGVIAETAARFSKVILFTSFSKNIEVMVERTNLRANVKGTNNREIEVGLIPQGADIKVGDRIVASPRVTGGRSGILVGEVVSVTPAEHEIFQNVRALQLFDPRENDVLVAPAQ